MKLSYLESVWQLIEVLSPLFEQSFAAIFDQVFSCGHVQGGWLQSSATAFKLPDNIAYGGYRNIKVSGDGLVALRLSMLGYNLVSDLLRQFSGFLSFLHVHCGAYSDTKQQNDFFSTFKLVD